MSNETQVKRGRPMKYPWLSLRIGESFEIPAATPERLRGVRNQAHQTTKRYPHLKLRVNKVGDVARITRVANRSTPARCR